MARRPFKPFRPYQPPPPPAGSYDPALDAQTGQVGRGLFDLGQDIGWDPAHGVLGTQPLRAAEDYGIGRGELLRQQGYGQQDLTTARDRGLADIGTQRQQVTDDHTRNLEMLARSYRQLAGRQGQQANAMGVLQGGALLQAAAKRQANQAVDQQPIDTAYGRAIGGLDTAQARTNENFTTGQARLGENTDYGLGQLALQMAPPDANNLAGPQGRQFQDFATQYNRAQREGAAFGLDVQGQKAYQAAGAGWAPPARGEPGGVPSNEFTDAFGNARRVIVKGGVRYTVDPQGNIIDRRRR
jgi:hypothetical protein